MSQVFCHLFYSNSYSNLILELSLLKGSNGFAVLLE